MMQDLVGIVRREDEMLQALEGLTALRRRAGQTKVGGNREYNPGWHTALDLHNLLSVSEAIARCGLARKESRGGHFRDDYPAKSDRFGRVNLVVHKGADGRMQLDEVPIPEMPADLKRIIEEHK
jgi:succinate dehydrogenase / fumarate reductase, flavoprotein subunit